jgi:guanidinopropionase
MDLLLRQRAHAGLGRPLMGATTACAAVRVAWRSGAGTPEAGGLTMVEAQRLIRAVGGLDVVGGDIVELSPPFDPSTITAQNAASVLFEVLCVLAQALDQRRQLPAT